MTSRTETVEKIKTPEPEEHWQMVFKEQKKNNTPAPQEAVFNEVCPDCKQKLEGEIIKESFSETDEEYPIKWHILWKCKCGYEYAELEEGRPVTIVDIIRSFFKKTSGEPK